MENTHPVYPFMHQFPFFYCQNWSPVNYHYLPGTINPQKQLETREFLGEPPRPQNEHVESPSKNGQTAKAMKSKKSLLKEKLRRKRDREDNYQRKMQKKDRNMPSNIFKNLANFFHLNPNIVEFVTKFIPAQLTVSPAKLIQKFKQTIKFGQSYIRPVAIQSLCKQGLFTKEEAQVFRIVLRRFLLVEMPVVIMSQNKLKRKQRSQYIKMGKKLLGQLNKGAFE